MRSADDTANPTLTVDTVTYMQSFGRFSSPFQAQIVQDFFAGRIDYSSFGADEAGNVIFTLNQLFEGGLPKSNASFSLSQYVTDVGGEDFVDRAFIWASTQFKLAPSTQFIVDADGGLSILGASIIPDGQENFDFVGGNSAINFINDTILRPLTDPYNIGRQVLFDFGNLDAWIVASQDVVLHASDAPINLFQSFATLAAAEAAVISAPALYALSSGALLGRIYNSIEYVRDGHNIVYGSSGDDILSDASVSWSHALLFAPTTFVAGDGHDVITSAIDESTIYGGGGDDVIALDGNYSIVYAGDDNDVINVHGKGETIFTGEGNDIVDVSNNTNQRFLAYIEDASTTDLIRTDGYALNGREKAIAGYIESGQTLQSTQGEEFELYSVDDKAIYSIDDYQTLNIYLVNNQQIAIDGFEKGMGGILADPQDRHFFTTDIAPITEGRIIDLSLSLLASAPYLEAFTGVSYLPIEYYTPLDPTAS